MGRRWVPAGRCPPRGDYRAPSDSEAVAWLNELELVPDCCDAVIRLSNDSTQ